MIQRQAESAAIGDVPDSWSSIEELLGSQPPHPRQMIHRQAERAATADVPDSWSSIE